MIRKLIEGGVGAILLLALVATTVKAVDLTIVHKDPAAVGSTGVVDATKQQIGNGSWANNGSKFSLWLSPSSLFGKSVLVSDIDEIYYYTYKDTAQSGLNFYINIYTDPYTEGSASWYGSRLTLEPMYSHSFSDTVGAWNKWSTNSGTNQLTLFDSNRSGAYGWYYPPTLSNIQAGSIDWNSYLSTAPTTNIDYSGETLKYIVIDTGSAWTGSFNGNVDALYIKLNDGDSVIVDLDLVVRMAEITAPEDGEQVNGDVEFAAYLIDDDEDGIQWAVREGTCDAGIGTVWGNVDGQHDPYGWNYDSETYTHTFASTANTSSWTPGMYCFVFNPREDGDESDIRLTREFEIVIPTIVIPTKAQILIDSGVPGKGLDNAPGLQKPFNPKSKAAENAGKK